jgi:2-methylisocitrate lyase-like PEP mutase family enzyme
MQTAKTLREKILQKKALLVPGAANALAARVIQSLGFEAVYLSGAGLTNTFYALPDYGFINLNDLAAHTSAIKDAVHLPLIVDADTGFGNALNVRHCIRVLERAGADAVQIEDQTSPKRCGHFEDKSVISTPEMISKIKAAVDARINPYFSIIARTDALSSEGLHAAIERANAYALAGADLIFIEAPQTLSEIQAIAALGSPQVMNIVLGGKTPQLSQCELQSLGFSIVLYANASLQGAIVGMQNALKTLKDQGILTHANGVFASFDERQALVDKAQWDELASKYE